MYSPLEFKLLIPQAHSFVRTKLVARAKTVAMGVAKDILYVNA